MKSETLPLLFIGGPADGQVKAIPATMTRIEVPYHLPSSGGYKLHDTLQFHAAVYERIRFGDTHFFYHGSDGPDEALRKLLRGYAPRLALAAKQQESVG